VLVSLAPADDVGVARVWFAVCVEGQPCAENCIRWPKGSGLRDILAIAFENETNERPVLGLAQPTGPIDRRLVPAKDLARQEVLVLDGARPAIQKTIVSYV